MKKNKSFKLIAGVVVIAVLGGVYYGLTVYNEKTEEAEEEAAAGETILEVDTSALTAVTYTIDGEQVSFSLQDDDTWQKDDDETFPVDSSALLAPLDEAAELKSVRTLTEVEDISEYGLDEPQNTITLTDEDGTETIITIGDNNASTGNDYLMLNEDETTIYTVSTDLSSAFSDDLYDYAESEELPTLQASTIVGVSLEQADGESYDLYLEDAIWMVSGTDLSIETEEETEVETDEDETAAEADTESETEEVTETETETEEEAETEEETEAVTITAEELAAGVEADADIADTLTSALAGLSYTDYLDHNCTNLSEYGLDEPAATLTITYEEEAETEEETETEEAADETEADTDTDGETESAEETETETETETEVQTIELTITFFIGDTDDSGNYYVQMEGSTEVHTISSSVLSTVFGYTASEMIAPEEEETETETEAESETEAETEDATE
ncbi:MAG: DUF4340 domain-containing protein [Lachnospiraceae bacterium]|nr:DUF4340 domain-containing protein [Lachnospiraceae bacterium]